VPVKGIHTATAVAAGKAHACALLAGGTVKCWGANRFGQLGDGTDRGSSTPVPVKGVRSATAISAGGVATTALLADGTIEWWGAKDPGTSSSRTPVRVKGIRNATAITTSWFHRCALLSSGTAKCWGDNDYAQLGDGTTRGSSTPVKVKGIRSATGIAAGGSENPFTCAVVSHGRATCWGGDWHGKLGDGRSDHIADVRVPVKGIHAATAISTGETHACALLAKGTVKCWGSNKSGQLGASRLRMSHTPVRVEGW
jgi:alpha-tubulin suppressor-like RCC1 family protein